MQQHLPEALWLMMRRRLWKRTRWQELAEGQAGLAQPALSARCTARCPTCYWVAAGLEWGAVESLPPHTSLQAFA